MAEGEAVHNGADRRVLGKSGLNKGNSKRKRGKTKIDYTLDCGICRQMLPDYQRNCELCEYGSEKGSGGEGTDTTSITVSQDTRSNARMPNSCPQCSSKGPFDRDGHRYLADGAGIQRWSCKHCGYRFSEKGSQGSARPLQKKFYSHLKAESAITSNRQICALEAKNLEPQTETKTVAGDLNQTQQGLILEFQWKMKKRQLADVTIESRTYLLSNLVRLGADLNDFSSVETVLATEEMTASQKFNTVKAYKAFTKAFKLKWEPVKIRYEAKEPFYPLEEEIDLLINACSKTTATFLQVAKDTGARISEIRKIQWTDIDEKNSTIAINHPAKGSRTRTVKVSEKTLFMIKRLRKNHGDYVFNPAFVSQRKPFNLTRKRMAERTQNPRLLKIHFHTLRHWRASMEYEKTGDIYAVKDLLGHKCISNTDRYQHGSFSNEEYVTKRPQTSQEEDELINVGFQFVRFDSKEGVPIYRKRK